MPHNFKFGDSEGIQFEEPNFDRFDSVIAQSSENPPDCCQLKFMKQENVSPEKAAQWANNQAQFTGTAIKDQFPNSKPVNIEILDADCQKLKMIEKHSVRLNTFGEADVIQIIESLQQSGHFHLTHHVSFLWDETGQYWIYLGILSESAQTKCAPYLVQLNDPEQPVLKLKFQLFKSETCSGSKQNQSCEHPSSNPANRVKERVLELVYQKVKEWRQLYTHGYRNPQTQRFYKINLDQAARLVGLSRKTLDDYYKQIRLGEINGFDFKANMQQKMGFLRQFNIKQDQTPKQKKKKLDKTQELQLAQTYSTFGVSHNNRSSEQQLTEAKSNEVSQMAALADQQPLELQQQLTQDKQSENETVEYKEELSAQQEMPQFVKQTQYLNEGWEQQQQEQNFFFQEQSQDFFDYQQLSEPFEFSYK